MILILCKPCKLCIRVIGDLEELGHLVGEDSDFWPDRYVCPTCEKKCIGVKELDSDPNILNHVTLVECTPEQAFAAMHGMGLPAEGDCRKEVVDELLKAQPIRRTKLKEIPHTNRCRVDYLELWDGTKLFFGAGAEGAVVYRITKPASYVEKIDGR